MEPIQKPKKSFFNVSRLKTTTSTADLDKQTTNNRHHNLFSIKYPPKKIKIKKSLHTNGRYNKRSRLNRLSVINVICHCHAIVDMKEN